MGTKIKIKKVSKVLGGIGLFYSRSFYRQLVIRQHYSSRSIR
jgi:hypothetical protein